GASCSGKLARIGVDARYRFLPRKSFGPWAGLGFGYEGLSHKIAGSVVGDFSRSVSGLELLNLQVGADIKAGPGVNIGPFLSYSLGKYDYASETTAPPGGRETTKSDNLANTAMHEWLVFGVYGTYEL